MLQLLVLLLFIKGSDYIKATNFADSFISTNLNAILLMCPNDINKDWSCLPQLIININFTPNLNVNNVEKLLILDEIYEPTKRQSFKIVSPYIIIVSRSEPMLMFPLLTSNGKTSKKNDKKNLGNNPTYDNTYHAHKVKLKRLRRRNFNPIAYNIFANLIKKKRENASIKSNSSIQQNLKQINEVAKTGSKHFGNSRTIFSAVKPTDELPEYSIYNLSAPFPYLAAKIRVFRKRKQTWWRIMPVISLNNLSGTFDDGNISALLTSHEDILHQRMPTFLEHFQLMIPNHFFTNPKELDGIRIYKSVLLELLNKSTNKFFNFGYTKKTMKSKGMKDILNTKPTGPQTFQNGPTSSSIFSKCPNNNQTLCLNVLDDQVPAFDIKIKMPFVENSAQQNIFRVKIARIVTDATTKDAVKIYVDVINKGLKAEEFLISICDCPLFESETEATTIVQKILLPYISETITFLLPFLVTSKKNNKFTCDVLVKANTQKSLKLFEINETKSSESNILIVSRRSMDIEVHSRCFCVWNCRCHCIGKIDSHTNIRVCQKMSYEAEKAAGLMLNCPLNDDSNDICSMDSSNEIPNNHSSTDVLYKMIEIILVLFIVLVLLVLFCCKCFKPRKEDLIVASTEWFCCPDNDNLITCSRYNHKLREPSRSVSTSTYSSKYFTKSDFVPADNVSICPSLEVSNHSDVLESALVTLARQQKELRKQSMKRE